MTLITAKQFSVDETGAYITELYDVDGNQVLFPRTMIGEKLRGGSHVCFPYFGPDGAGILPQHGFGRTVPWHAEVSPDGRTVTCTYDRNDDDEIFGGLDAELRYELNEAGNELVTTLTVTNNSDQPLPVTPGFHPYLTIDPTDTVLNGQRIVVADFEPFQSFPDMTQMRLETAGRTVAISSKDLTHMIVWTDSKGNYLCIEPTIQGNGFNSERSLQEGVLPGDTVSYNFSINW